MHLDVAGFDPSLTHWGIAEGRLDLETGILDKVSLSIVEPIVSGHKQVRQNSKDLHTATQLAEQALRVGRRCQAIFVECPVGSQSARAMASYGICMGVLGSLRAEGVEIIEVTAIECKLAMAGLKSATKAQMIEAAVQEYPDANWPRRNLKGKSVLLKSAEHVADALGAIHAGVNTPVFRNLMRLLEKVN